MANAVANTRAVGLADVASFYRRWCAENPLYSKLFVSRVEMSPFNQEGIAQTVVPSMAFLAWVGVYLADGIRVNRPEAQALAIADLFLPEIKLDRLLNRNEARELLVDSVTALLESDSIATYTDADIAALEVDAVTEEEISALSLPDNFSLRVTEQNHEPPRMTPHQALLALYRMTIQMRPSISIGGLTFIVVTYLAVLKRGNMTQQFLDKVVNGVREDLGVASMNINPETCQTLYRVFGSQINDQNIPVITARWSGLLPEQALRLRLTVTQASGSGLTALVVIGVAILKYPDFRWLKIKALFPGEFAAFDTARAAVGNNVWYGFRHDLGPVKSTLYKNLAYVAKELLIKIDGKGTLNQYRGWTNAPKYRAILDTMIADYETHVMNVAFDRDQNDTHFEVRMSDDAISTIITALNAAAEVYTM